MKPSRALLASAVTLLAPLNASPRHRPQAPRSELVRTLGRYDMLVRGTVASLLYSTDGRELLAFQDDRSVRAWNLGTSVQLGHWPSLSMCLVPGVGFSGGQACGARACEVQPPAALLPDGRHVATADESGVTVCDLSGRTPKTELPAPQGGVVSADALAASPQDRWLVVGNDDGSLTVYEAPSAPHPRRFKVHGGPVLAVGTEGSEPVAVSVGADGKVVATDLSTGHARASFSAPSGGRARGACGAELVQAAAVSPDGTLALVATRSDPSKACSTQEAHVRLLSTRSGQLLWDVVGSPVWAAAFSPDSRELALATAVHPEDTDEPNPMEVIRVDVKTGRPVDPEAGHHAPVTAVQFSRDGQLLATGDGDGALRVFSARTGEQTGAANPHGGAVTAVAFSPDGKGLLTQTEDDSTRLFTAPDARAVRVVIPGPKQQPREAGCLTAAEAHAQGPSRASATGPLVRPPLPVEDPEEFQLNLALPNEAVWLASREVLAPVAEESCVGLAGTCNYGCDRSYSLVRVAAQTGKVLQRFPKIDEELLARCNRRPDVILTQAPKGGVHAYAPDGTLVVGFGASLGKVISCDATPDGRRLLLATRTTLALVDGRTFQPLDIRHRPAGRGGEVALAPDGAHALDVSGTRVRMLHLPGGELIETLGLGNYEDIPTTVSFSPDGDSFVVGTARGVALQFATRPRSASNP